jgi:glucose-1-phosphate thymidylyltransferase
MLSGIREYLLISTPTQLSNFQLLLGDGSQFGVNICYKIQEHPSGIAESLILGGDFVSDNKVALILGDNIFHGTGLGRSLANYQDLNGAHIFGYTVGDPSPYGVATIDSKGKVLDLQEKPTSSKSRIAIPGLYFFDQTAAKRAKTLLRSSRGELEIIDLLRNYLTDNLLKLKMLPRGTVWFDSGTFHDLHESSVFVKLMQERTGERIGDPLEVAKIKGWIN